MNKYITRGITNNLSPTLQHQIWDLVLQKDTNQSNEQEPLDYFHIFQFIMHQQKLFIRHTQENPEYFQYTKANDNHQVNISKVYVIREDDVDFSYYVMLLPEEY
ncbi:DUF960 family protein [Staphylococcus aureus]|uniref:DUF960 family protein n=1 Tax=Staphylococcus aureus TaxID=1280 RepID=UPI00122EE54F|nr:DUF960 family protein [Staphylococcus aureus]MEA1224882.1 DUF960 domain-containing protein [Staphylococcus aureus]MEA1234242.1 DUF960 domain-containing protein [Staphylococcus aureus]QEQ40080.1 hypothetical protein FD746_00240 [Staphylococcus aureus]